MSLKSVMQEFRTHRKSWGGTYRDTRLKPQPKETGCKHKFSKRDETGVCEVCGTSFSYQRDPRVKPRKTCSTACANHLKRSKQRRRVEVACPHCGKHFEKRPSESKRYCSSQCAYQGRKKSPVCLKWSKTSVALLSLLASLPEGDRLHVHQIRARLGADTQEKRQECKRCIGSALKGKTISAEGYDYGGRTYAITPLGRERLEKYLNYCRQQPFKTQEWRQ